MSNEEIKNGAGIVYIVSSFAFYMFLILAKALGAVNISWLVVLLGCLWVPLWIPLWCYILAFCAGAAAYLKHRLRRRKKDRRIIRQAKATGVWDRPQALGGRALELKVRKDFKIEREPGETDAELRRKVMAAIDAKSTGKAWRCRQ